MSQSKQKEFHKRRNTLFSIIIISLQTVIMKPIITVFGATGSQGGSVAQALLKGGKYAVRATTRNVDSPKAQALKDAGFQVVQASYSDSASLEQAMEGAYGAWFITSFWDSGVGTVEAEVADGRRVAQAAKKAKIQHLMYSTLESPATTFGDSFPTFDAKIGVEQEILYQGVPFSFVQVAWYYTNLANNIQNKHAGYYDWPQDDDGAYILRFPIGGNGLHAIYSGDVGVACANMFALWDRVCRSQSSLFGRTTHSHEPRPSL